jgi:SAM-dependent methyltransferase
VFTKSARYYDAIYGPGGIDKDYAGEAERVHALIQQHNRTRVHTLLDVGCGTGLHITHLRAHYAVEGLDLNPDMLDIARQRHPGIPFHQADMADFDLGRQFGAVVCLFSSIGYVRTLSRLRQALETFARHTWPGGVVIVEPWFTPDTWKPNTLHALFVDEPDLKIARMNISQTEDGVSVLDFTYLVGTLGGIEHFTERHELGLFTREDYLDAFRRVGLDVMHDPEGLAGRGTYIGRKPLA